MKAILLSIKKANLNLDDNLKLWKKQGFDLLGTFNVNEPRQKMSKKLRKRY